MTWWSYPDDGARNLTRKVTNMEKHGEKNMKQVVITFGKDGSVKAEAPGFKGGEQRRKRMAPIPFSSEDDSRKLFDSKKGIYVDSQRVYWKKFEEEGKRIWLKCFPSGNWRDQETEEVLVHYGRVFVKTPWSPEAEERLRIAIRKKMQECFPDSSYLEGKIPRIQK